MDAVPMLSAISDANKENLFIFPLDLFLG